MSNNSVAFSKEDALKLKIMGIQIAKKIDQDKKGDTNE